MPDLKGPTRRLPDRPSREHLRKAAKRLAKAKNLQLTRAQRQLAQRYGFRSWADLMSAVDDSSRLGPSALSQAAAQGDEASVRAMLGRGAEADGASRERDTPLYLVCDSDVPAERRLAIATMLIEAGAFVRRGCASGATPLHAAARRGPAAMVELLLHNGALLWQPDDKGRRAFDYAQSGTPIDRDRILYLCAEGPRIEDEDFRAAVDAIQTGDAGKLARLLDARPGLLHERAIEPDIGAPGYFTDPGLFWFVANNPTLVPQSPPNVAEIASLMIDRGVEQGDLDYTLELVMTNGMMPEPTQLRLVQVLVEAGAIASRQALLMTLGHAQTAPVRWLLGHGVPASAPVAAGLGQVDALPALLEQATPKDRNDALAMAVINREAEAARLCLEAGADPSRFMPCHAHSTPLHQAALHGDVETMKLLVAHGARPDTKDTLWHGTPLSWAIHGGQAEAEAYLRSLP